MHALFRADPSRFGPYSPSTRLFLNPLHASPAQVFGEAHVADTLRAEGLSETFQRLEALSLIDWPAAPRAKHRLLRALFEPFIDAASAYGKLHLDFARFRASTGGELLRTTRGVRNAACRAGSGWCGRLASLADRSARSGQCCSHGICGVRTEREVLFHSFLQWLADRSFGIAQSAAHSGSGMRIGLIGDLAVGMDPSGSHAWSRQGDVLGSLSIGAPPDLLNPHG